MDDTKSDIEKYVASFKCLIVETVDELLLEASDAELLCLLALELFPFLEFDLLCDVLLLPLVFIFVCFEAFGLRVMFVVVVVVDDEEFLCCCC